MNEHEYIVYVLRTNTGSTLLRRISYLVLFVSVHCRFFFPFFSRLCTAICSLQIFFFVSTLQSVSYRFSLFLYCSFFVHCMIYCFTIVFFLHCMIYYFTAVFSYTAWFIALLQFFVSVQYYKKLLQFFSSVLYLLQVIQIFVSFRYYKKNKLFQFFFFSFLYNLSY